MKRSALGNLPRTWAEATAVAVVRGWMLRAPGAATTISTLQLFETRLTAISRARCAAARLVVCGTCSAVAVVRACGSSSSCG